MAKKKKTTKKKAAKKKTIKAKQPNVNGRAKNGQLAKGNQAAKGHKNPAAQQKREFAQWFKNAVTKDDIVGIAKNLVTMAKSSKSRGSIAAAKEVLDRCMGKAKESHDVQHSWDALDNLLDQIAGNNDGLPGE